ncbi:hypothetical protein ASE66_05790 [Bosea sp. Root483D1]|nr:hypothetical protein ASE66_05790 [Bosea sp. Root483D1]
MACFLNRVVPTDRQSSTLLQLSIGGSMVLTLTVRSLLRTERRRLRCADRLKSIARSPSTLADRRHLSLKTW